ncbi:MAG: phosphotransferase family protein [Tetrasphaera sp.]
MADPRDTANTAAVPALGGVRAEDAFDVTAVAKWLRHNAADATGLDEAPEVRQFSGGASNLTFLLSWPERELILRRPPAGTKAKGAHDMAREHDIQAALAPVYPKVVPMVGYCGDESVIGSEFYVMERLVGPILRKTIPPELGLTAGDVTRLCDNAIDALVELHAVDVDAAGLARLDRGPGYVHRQVEGWSRRYRAARTPDVGSLEELMSWLDRHQPDDVQHTLIHNDFRFDNLVLGQDDPTRIVGVLDWELATVGDPLMDLGSALAYWAQADDPAAIQAIRLQPTTAPGMWTREQVWAAYEQRRAIEVSERDRRFYELFGTFRLAGIAQQIYYRYVHGQTTNPTARGMGEVVRILDARSRELIA